MKITPITEMKLELSIEFFLLACVKIQLTGVSELIQNLEMNQTLYTDQDGFLIKTGSILHYDRRELVLPTYLDYEKTTDTDLRSHFIFLSDTERYNCMKRLYGYIWKLSQSRVFQYDNTGHVKLDGDKWLVH